MLADFDDGESSSSSLDVDGRLMLGMLNDGVLVLPGTRQVHTVGMRFAIDVAWCDEQGTVVRVATLAPNRLGAWVRRARTVLEAEAGRFDEWGLRVDDRLAWDEAPRN